MVLPAAMVHVTFPAPRMPESSDSPPQQSVSLRQRSPWTWQPCACWQIVTPVAPYGAHRSLQHPPGQPTLAGSQSTPSTSQEPPGGTEQVPGFVADTGDAFGEVHTPPQQLVASKQMSFVCVQNDEPILQVPFEQSPEQHSMLDEQVLPAVVHVPPTPIGAHFPATQVSVQHALPDVGHAAPSETHWAALHVPLTHAPVQQSVPTAQVIPPGPQEPPSVAPSFVPPPSRSGCVFASASRLASCAEPSFLAPPSPPSVEIATLLSPPHPIRRPTAETPTRSQ
jgi:hypothetical protein